MITINQGQMAILTARGLHPVIPSNGPNDGDPQYSVPSTYAKYLVVPTRDGNDEAEEEILGHTEDPIDPALLG